MCRVMYIAGATTEFDNQTSAPEQNGWMEEKPIFFFVEFVQNVQHRRDETLPLYRV